MRPLIRSRLVLIVLGGLGFPVPGCSPPAPEPRGAPPPRGFSLRDVAGVEHHPFTDPAKEATGELTTLAIGLTRGEAEADGSAVTAAWDTAARRMRKWERKAVRDDLAELSGGEDDDADELGEEEWRLRRSKKAKRDAEFAHAAEEAVRTVEVMLSKGVKAEDIVRRLDEWKREPGRKGQG